MSNPEFVKNEEMNKIVKSLCDERADLFPKVTPAMIESCLREDKLAPKNTKDVLKIKGIRGPVTCLTDKKYIIHAYKSIWDEQPLDKRIAYLAFALKHIAVPTDEQERDLAEKGKDWEWGKINKPDLNTFKSFTRVFGLDWEQQETIPNLIEETSIIL